NDVPRRERNHSAPTVLPPMNPARQLLVERDIDRAEQADEEQAGFAETFPQSQPDITELHRHNLPCQWHPERRAPDHRAAANRVIECARVIDQPRVSGKLSKSDDNSEEKKSREQCVTLEDRKADQQTVIDHV